MAGPNGCAQLLRDDVSAVIIQTSSQIISTPSDDLEVDNICMPHLVNGHGLVLEIVCGFLHHAILPKQCGFSSMPNICGIFRGKCSSSTFLQRLCFQRISCSSSLLDYDEPEILFNQIIKSAPNALTLDMLHNNLHYLLATKKLYLWA